MTMTIDLESPRTARALAIAANAGAWLKCRARDGRKAYGIPSQCQPGRYYLVTCSSCDCPDAQRHPGEACKHRQAVQIHVALVNQSLRKRGAATRATSASAALVDRYPVTWTSHEKADGTTVHMPSSRLPADVVASAKRYDDIFKRLEGE